MRFVPVCIVILLASCAKEAPPASKPVPAESSSNGVIEIPSDSPKLAQIQVAEVRLTDMPTDEFTAPGKIVANPNRVSKVLLPVAGRVTDVFVKLGDSVRKNQILLSMESPEADAASSAMLQAEGAVAQAASALRKAENDLSRVQDLFKGDAIAKKEVVAAEVNVAQAKAALKQSQATLDQARSRLDLLGLDGQAEFRRKIAVRAPLDGKITEMTIVAGEYRNDLSVPLLTISDLSTVWIAADVPESSIRLVRTGEHFDVTLTAFPGEVFKSRVARIADSVDPQTRAISVWAELANPQGRLRPDMFGEVRHIEDYRKVPSVPLMAVIQAQKRTIVYRELAKGKFAQVDVEAGKKFEDRIPILSGVKQGDRIVVDGAMLLRGY